MSDIAYVKCEDCGRRLPGPQRRCDVCGGKMTYSAADSYFTPEGRIRKNKYSNRARNTPDRDLAYTPTDRTSGYTDISSGTKSKSTPSQIKMNTYSTPVSGESRKSINNKKPLIDRIGDAVDIIGEDNLRTEDVKNIGKILVGWDTEDVDRDEVDWQNLADVDENEYDNDNDDSSLGLVVKIVIGLIVAIIFFFL